MPAVSAPERPHRGAPTADDTDEALIARMRSGDELAVAALLHRYRPLVHRTAQRYFFPGGDPDDVVQEGMVGLYSAVMRFDPSRSPSFAPFAALCVRNQVLTALASAQRLGNAPLNTAAPLALVVGEGRGGHRVEPACGPTSDPAEQAISREALRSLGRFIHSRLTPLEREALHQFLDGQAYEVIGATLGISAKAVDNALQRVRRKLAAGYLHAAGAA